MGCGDQIGSTMKVTVYHIETGKAVDVEGVDAKEYVASGGWATEKPASPSKAANSKRAQRNT